MPIIGIVLFFYMTLSKNLLAMEDLAKILANEYMKKISKTRQGREIIRRVKSDDIKIYLEYSDDGWLAWYEGNGKIFFNLKYFMIFFSIEDYDKDRIEYVLKHSKEVRDEFIRYTDFLFVHELIHHIQDKRYEQLKNYRSEFVELEYEAFLMTDIYFYEKMKKEKKLFRDILAGKYYDLYTEYAMGGFISSFDEFDKYLDAIKKRYLDEIKGYVSLSEQEIKKKVKLEEKKILSYAGGEKDIYEKSKKEYLELRKLYERYLIDINKRLKKIWFSYLYDALNSTIKTAAAVENYSVIWRGCYFFHKLYNKNCLDLVDKSIEINFKKHLDKKDDLILPILVEEIYWYEKFVKDIGFSSIINGLYNDIIKDAIVFCDKNGDKQCLNMIDEIYNFDLVK